MRRTSSGLSVCAGLLALMTLFGSATAALAVQPDEILPDPALESRARAISAHLRCLVCQNQSIDDSNAPLAKDLRVLVRERLKANDTDEQVLDYVVARYGDFVLLRPPFKTSTWLLWGAPLMFLALAVWLARKSGFGRQGANEGSVPAPLSAEEARRLETILKPGKDA